MSKKEESYQEENAKLLREAEKLASQLSINLVFFYEERVRISDQYRDLNNARKVPYEELSKADSFGANNGFKGIVNEFESILNFVNEFYEGNFEVYNSDELNKEIYEGHLRIVESYFEHICKWIGNEKES